MKAVNFILDTIPPGGVLSIVQRDAESCGELFSLMLLKKLLKDGETVFVVLYEPFRSFKTSCRDVGLDIKDHLGKNLFVLDVFGSTYGITRNEDGIYQMSGYLDDSVFVIKAGELAKKIAESREWEHPWIFTYTSSSICKLFSHAHLVYRLIWGVRGSIFKSVSNVNTVLILFPPECPEIEDMIYFTSDVVLETFVNHGQRIGTLTKGGEERIVELFGDDEQ